MFHIKVWVFMIGVYFENSKEKKYYLKIELLPFFKVCTTTNILKLLFLKTFFHKTLQPGNDVHIIT